MRKDKKNAGEEKSVGKCAELGTGSVGLRKSKQVWAAWYGCVGKAESGSGTELKEIRLKR